jgi:predicted SnoaL-like aldol condensation-catalyzing enzyme
MTKKEIAIDFLQQASAGNVAAAYDKHVHPQFRHHSPWFKGDRESLMQAMQEAHESNPNEFLEVKRTLSEGDLVAVHSHVRQADGTDIAVVHIMRFEGESIIEMWDVGLAVPVDSPNENGPF